MALDGKRPRGDDQLVPANVLIWLSTIAWFILTGILFVLLARWSTTTGSWTILPGLVRGVRTWAAREAPARPMSSSPASVDAAPVHAPDEVAEIVELS